jgi:phosphate:Na+ symporter
MGLWKLAWGLGLFVAGFLLLRKVGALWAIQNSQLVERYLGRPWPAFVVALLATGLLHSSSAFLTLLVGLAQSGTVPIVALLAAILGANVGTTTTAQLASLPTPNIFLLLAGLLLFFSGQGFQSLVWLFFRPGRLQGGKGSSPKDVGLLLFGLGLLLTGLGWAGQAASFANWPQLARYLAAAQTSPLAGVLAGALASAIIQSSTLLVGFLMGLVTGGKISLPCAVAIVVGANVGTTADVLVAAIGTKAPARRVAVGHLVVNAIGALLYVIFPMLLVKLVAGQSPARAVAWAHTFFNLSGLLLWPFLPALAKLLLWLVPEDHGKERNK